MINNKQDDDVVLLTQIENISKKISDLVNHGQYKNIEKLNQIKLDLIKKFKNKNNENFKTIIKIIRKDNIENIKTIECKLNKIKNERSKFIKRLKAYGN